MIEGARVVVVVPAFNEAPRIASVVRTIPSCVDQIIVVDDASQDRTFSAAKSMRDARVTVVRHPRNRGVGAAIVTGYRHAQREAGSPNDAFVVMAGDGQMDPDDLVAVATPVVLGQVGYVKGNRFAHQASRAMPWTRRVGGEVFSIATSLAIGSRIRDSQCGYTAIARWACDRIGSAETGLDSLWPRYGYPNDLLSMLVRERISIAHVPVRPIYFPGARGLGVRHLPRMAWIVIRARNRLRE